MTIAKTARALALSLALAGTPFAALAQAQTVQELFASEPAGAGGYQAISKTWQVKFDGAQPFKDAEVHVFVSIKNATDTDQYISPGTFIPNLINQEAEGITNRAVYRASGDPAIEFRPTVPAGGEVRIRYIFRPEQGTAQPKAFTLEAFGYEKFSFDVSSVRLGSLALDVAQGGGGNVRR